MTVTFLTWLESAWTSFQPHARQRQRTLPFDLKPQWNLKPDTYLSPGFHPDEEFGVSYDNLYHVTTNLRGVAASGRLVPRSELGVSGLGGGAIDESPNMVSTTHNRDRAFAIYEEIRYVCEVARGAVKASEVARNFELQDEDAVEEVLKSYVPKKYLGEDGDWDAAMKILDRRVRTGKKVYEFFQACERAVDEAGAEEWGRPQGVVGFTAPHEDVVRIDPKQVAIIQVVARKGARAEHVPVEQEIRFRPQDLQIVRYLQP